MRRMLVAAMTAASWMAFPLPAVAGQGAKAAVPSRPAATAAARDRHGRIARSAPAKHSFRKAHPCPATGSASGACPGYVIDHITALKRGGADHPANMQWQTLADAKAKDRVE